MRCWIENELIELINSDQFRLSIPIQFQLKIFQFNSNSIHSVLTDQLWCRHNAKSEKTVLSDNDEMSVRRLFFEEFVQDIKWRVRNKMIHLLQWITIFWSLVRWFANDFHEWLHHHKVVIHDNSCIILYLLIGLDVTSTYILQHLY